MQVPDMRGWGDAYGGASGVWVVWWGSTRRRWRGQVAFIKVVSGGERVYAGDGRFDFGWWEWG